MRRARRSNGMLTAGLPALIASGNFCLRGRQVPPGGDIYDVAG